MAKKRSNNSNTAQGTLIAHIIYRLDFGGLENGLVNLINTMPETKYTHAIICLTDYSDFSKRIKSENVKIYALHKKEGHDIGLYFRLWKLLHQLKPGIVHTRNIGTLEFSVVAALAGVPVRVHGEHGRDMRDIDGGNRKYILLRKCFNLFVNKFIAMSMDLQQWLVNTVGIPECKVTQIYNGVDLAKFSLTDANTMDDNDQGLKQSSVEKKSRTPDMDNWPSDAFVIGHVGRLQGEKDQLTLLKAFSRLQQDGDIAVEKLRLMIIGDGPMRSELEDYIERVNLQEKVWMAGSRKDVPVLMKKMNLFVLSSLGEGISNTILEAMACGLPVVATAVGGNIELVENNKTGKLVPAADSQAMADAIKSYVLEKSMAVTHGKAGYEKVRSSFSMDRMVDGYLNVYDQVTGIADQHSTVSG